MTAEIFQMDFIISLIAGMVRISTPLLFAALGELIVERSGLMNLGVEGLMLMGSFIGFITAYLTGSLWLGLIAAGLAAGLMSILFAILTSTLKADQTVTGLAINILSSGLTFYLYRVVFKNLGTSNLPNIPIFQEISIPFISKIPIIGPSLFKQSPLTFIALLMVFVIYWFLYKTKYGLILRCIGDNPRAMDMKGIRIAAYQYLAVFFGGIMAGFGGAFLTISSAGLFLPDITGGRGWIAIAIVIFGNWNPFLILLAAWFFGLLDTFQLQIQGLGVEMPYQILLALPYVLTIAAITIGRQNSGSPLHLGVPYKREEK